MPLRLRCDKLKETIFRTLLFGCGAWAYTDSVVGILNTVERKTIRVMLNRTCPNLVSEADFHGGLTRKITSLMEVFSWTPLRDLAHNLHVSWMGHLARMPAHSALRSISEWRNAEWQLSSSQETLRARAGRPRPEMDSQMSQIFGVCWAELAQKGHDWRNAKHTYLQHVGALYEHRDDVVQWDRI